MEITEVRKDFEAALILKGRIDVNASSRLEQEIKQYLSLMTIRKLVLVMNDVEYISSAGIRVILSAHKNMKDGRQLVIKNPSQFCRQVFEVTGADIFLNIV
jgi:anti-sigma B factor antagonist